MLYFEPLCAINGAILALFCPTSLFSIMLPPNTSISITAIHEFLITNIASLWLFFAIIEAIVLRLTSDLKIWCAVVGAMLVSDIGFLYAPQRILPGWDVYWRVDQWRWEEWVNIGSSSLLLLIRVAFLVWVLAWWNGTGAEEEKKRTE